MYSEGVVDQDYLRGVQVAGSDGRVSFTTVFPGCYDGRWPHAHVEVYASVDGITDTSTVIATSQLALPQDACEAVYATSGYEGSAENLSRLSLTSDGVFGDDGGAAQLGTVTGTVQAGFRVELSVPVDTRTAAGGGGSPGGPPPGR